MLLKAAEPWSTGTHQLFPAAARQLAVTLLLLGHEVAAQMGSDAGAVGSLSDAWVEAVLPFAIERTSSAVGGCVGVPQNVGSGS